MVICVAAQGLVHVILAVEAPVGPVGLVAHVIRFVGGHQLQAGTHDLREFDGLLTFAVGKARGHGKDAERLLLELLRGHPQHQAAVHTAGVGDKHTVAGANPLTQTVEFIGIERCFDHDLAMGWGMNSF